jgi:hypothetical protein
MAGGQAHGSKVKLSAMTELPLLLVEFLDPKMA